MDYETTVRASFFPDLSQFCAPAPAPPRIRSPISDLMCAALAERGPMTAVELAPILGHEAAQVHAYMAPALRSGRVLYAQVVPGMFFLPGQADPRISAAIELLRSHGYRVEEPPRPSRAS